MTTTTLQPTRTPDTRPADLDTDDGDLTAHYADKDAITQAVIEGGKVTALCGYRFEPVHDPTGKPVCQVCSQLLGALLDG
jgi:hypothetical protein